MGAKQDQLEKQLETSNKQILQKEEEGQISML
jgi:hypothetical protein